MKISANALGLIPSAPGDFTNEAVFVLAQDVLDLEEIPENLVLLGLQVRKDAKEIQVTEETLVSRVSILRWSSPLPLPCYMN